MPLEDRMNIRRRSRDDAWQLVNERLTTGVDRASATLSERIAGIEQIVQSRSNTPATMSIQSPSGHEDLEQLESRIDARFQAFTHEVDQFQRRVGSFSSSS